MFDALYLARLRFAFTVSFHFIFPAFSIGLASFLLVLEALWLRTGQGVHSLLGSCWLIWKTEGALHKHARRLAKWLAIGLIAAIALVSAATPFLEGRFYERWFGWPGVLTSAQMPLLVAITAFALLRSIKGGRDWLPFVLTLFLLALARRCPGKSLYLGGRSTGAEPTLHTGRCRDSHSDHTRLHDLGLLGVQREDQ
jgi:hypothetical protein